MISQSALDGFTADVPATDSRRTYSVPEVRVITVNEGPALESVMLNQPNLAADFFHGTVKHASWFDPEKECMVVLCLDRKNRLKGWNLVSLGSATNALAHPREVYRAAVGMSAAAILCMHNHPSGDPAPSASDIQVTRVLAEAGKVLDIGLLDHVIIGRAGADPCGLGHYSFRNAGML